MASLRAALVIAAATVVAACQRTQSPSSALSPPAAADLSRPIATVHAGPPSGVAWFAGDVARAFDLARKQNKPVFVYFGAVWCPPCQELKATIFRRKDFLDRLSLFVPVYLDGDAPDAQRWADEFRVEGYPTVLILRSDRSEIERVSGGMDLTRYAELLDDTAAAGHPIEAILASVNQGERLSLNDCRILAYNGWQLDLSWTDGDENPQALRQLADVLARSSDACPPAARIERARLDVTAAAAAADLDAAALKSGKDPSPRLASSVMRVRPLLNEPAAKEIGDTLIELPQEFFIAADRLDPRSAAGLEKSYIALMDRLASDARYSTAMQLYALMQEIAAAQALEPSGKAPQPMVDKARQRMELELRQVREPYARTSVVNAALNLLDQLGDQERSYSLLLTEVKTSSTPYYYMSDLGELEEKRGHRDAAIEWLARGYDESRGSATRIQWGSAYVRGLIRMRPTDEKAIRGGALEVFTDLGDGTQIHGRNRYALERLAVAISGWNKDGKHAATVRDLRASLGRMCQGIPRADSANEACRKVLGQI